MKRTQGETMQFSHLEVSNLEVSNNEVSNYEVSHLARRLLQTAGVILALITTLVVSPQLSAEDNGNRGAAQLFASLPNGASGPEGLTVGPDGNIYVATFGFNQNGSVTGLGQPGRSFFASGGRSQFQPASAGHRLSSAL
jgi:hypothetical protein